MTWFDHITLVVSMILIFSAGYRLSTIINVPKARHEGYLQGVADLRDMTLKTLNEIKETQK